ncbi:FAD binding domain-containing protein [Kibdelosporangium aridum]|uniref:FAD binding domain-containing protein n=1 Tax=Kibdelosporangium aridum TaxID=2030 RepID=UPI000691C456
MKPVSFEYLAPRTIAQAVADVSESGDVAVLAGGQSLLPELNARTRRPDLVVDLGRVAELRTSATDDTTVFYGAMARLSELDTNAFPALTAAIRTIGDFEIRNRSTVGGTIVYANPAGQFLTVAAALGAQVVTVASTGSRTTELPDFLRGAHKTALRSGELVTGVRLRAFARRQGFAIVGRHRRVCACAVENDGLVASIGGMRQTTIVLSGSDLSEVIDAVRQRTADPYVSGLAVAAVRRAVEGMLR